MTHLNSFFDVTLVNYDSSTDTATIKVEDYGDNSKFITFDFVSNGVDTVIETFTGDVSIKNDTFDFDMRRTAVVIHEALKAVYSEFSENDETIADVFARIEAIAFDKSKVG